MITVNLIREKSHKYGTPGHLSAYRINASGFTEDEFFCQALELPWKDNQKRKSCIPTGTYTCALYPSRKFGMAYLVQGVPERSGILFHPGNFAGDEDEGLKSDVEGCILLGDKFGKLEGQFAILHSTKTLNNFKEFTKNESFTLKILNEVGLE